MRHRNAHRKLGRVSEHRTALLQACTSGNVDIAGVLLDAGADRNAQDANGMTPLLAATRDSWHGRPEAVMTLLANGADARATDNDTASLGVTEPLVHTSMVSLS